MTRAIAIGGPAHLQFLSGEGDKLTVWYIQSLSKDNPRQIPHDYSLKEFVTPHGKRTVWVYSKMMSDAVVDELARLEIQ